MAHYDQNQKEVSNRGPGQPASAATRPPNPVSKTPDRVIGIIGMLSLGKYRPRSLVTRATRAV